MLMSEDYKDNDEFVDLAFFFGCFLVVVFVFSINVAIGSALNDHKAIKKEKVYKILKSNENIKEEEFVKLGVAKYNEKNGYFEFIYE